MDRFGKLLMLFASLPIVCAWAATCLAQPAPAPAALSFADMDQTNGPAGSGILAQPTETPPAGPEEILPQPKSSKPAGDPKLGDGTVALRPAPLENTDLPLPINLAAALQLADARPLLVA